VKQLLTRTITGAVFVAVTVFLILFCDYSLLAFLIIANTWLSVEFYKLFHLKKKYVIPSIIINLISIIFTFLIIKFQWDIKYLWFFLPLIFINFIIALYEKNTNVLNNLSISILSFVYLTIPFILIPFLTLKNNVIAFGDNIFDNSRYLLIVILALIWINDSFAYLFGCFVFKKKRHALFERISPKKSWEGSLGGALITLIVAFFLNRFLPLSMLDSLAIALIVIIFGTFGDLVESMFKRNLGVKDSGKSLPGHGGLLDRLDSFIFSVPFVFLYFLLKQIVL
jgi:phosphatidate cytidylyltransferase